MKTIKNKKIESINSVANIVCYSVLFFSAGCDLLLKKQALGKVSSKKHQGCQEQKGLAAYQDEDTHNEDRQNKDTEDEPNAIDNEGYERSPKGSEDQGKDPEQSDSIEPSPKEKKQPTNPSTISLKEDSNTANKKLISDKNDSAKLNKSAKTTQNEENKKTIATASNRDKGKKKIELNENQLSTPAQKETDGFTAATDPLEDVIQKNGSSDQRSVTLEELQEKALLLENMIKVNNDNKSLNIKHLKDSLKKCYTNFPQFKKNKSKNENNQELIKTTFKEINASILLLETVLKS